MNSHVSDSCTLIAWQSIYQFHTLQPVQRFSSISYLIFKVSLPHELASVSRNLMTL